MKVALVYDWLDSQVGGAEMVILALHRAFPTAPLYVAYQTKNAPFWAKDLEIHTSWMQNCHWWWRHWKFLTPFFLPQAFESFDFDDYEVIISVSSFAAKGILTKPEQIHLDYTLTPPRWLYSHQDDYLSKGKKRFLGRKIQKLQRMDKIIAQRPDAMIAISQLVAKRINNTYQRNAETVIYPPVDILKWQKYLDNREKFSRDDKKCLSIKNRNFMIGGQEIKLPAVFDLIVARHVAYKKIDVAIEAAVATNSPLIIVGVGPQTRQLQKLALRQARGGVMIVGKNSLPDRGKSDQREDDFSPLIYFLGKLDDEQLAQLYQLARLLIMVGEEDFGITALEAKFFGLPVIIHHNSGASELLTNKQNAYFLPTDTKKDLIIALNYLGNNFFPREQLHVKKYQNKLQYTTDDFVACFQKLVERLYHQLIEKNN